MLIEDSLTKVHNKFAFRLAKNTTIKKNNNVKVDHTTATTKQTTWHCFDCEVTKC